METQTFEAALEDFIAEINRVRNKNQERFTNLVQGTSFVEVTGGAKYAGLIVGDASGGGRSRYGFVRRSDGAVLYAAGWARPFIGKSEVTTVRGNIFDASTWAQCVGPYGVLTLNRRG